MHLQASSITDDYKLKPESQWQTWYKSLPVSSGDGSRPSSGARLFAQVALQCPGGKAAACALGAALCASAIGTRYRYRSVDVSPSDRTASTVA